MYVSISIDGVSYSVSGDDSVVNGDTTEIYGEDGDPTPTYEPDQFFLVLPTDSLVGYTGSAICSSSLPCGGTETIFGIDEGEYPVDPTVFVATSGTLELPGADTATPEPSTIALLSTGLLGTATLLRRRLTQSTAHPAL